MAGIGCMLWCVCTHMVCGGPDCLRNGQVVLIRSLFPTTHWWEPPQTEVTINQQKAELWHAICVCVYSICVCTFTLEGPNEYIFCLSMSKTGRKLCSHHCGVTFSHAHKMWTSLLQKWQIQCDLAICKAKSVVYGVVVQYTHIRAGYLDNIVEHHRHHYHMLLGMHLRC